MIAPKNESARILVVDDEDTLRLVLAKFLRTRGFEVATADSGDAALEALSEAHFDLMLCDVRMPGLSGVEIVPTALEINPDLGIVMLSAVNDAPTATEALAQGVLDYLIKPVELQKLYEAVTRALQKRAGLKGQRRSSSALANEVAVRTEEFEREKFEMGELTLRVLETLVNAMEAKDSFHRGNSIQVAHVAASIAEYLGLGPEVVEDVRVAAGVCDIGNVGIRGEVLAKPGKLNPDEVAHVRDHVRIGVEILTPLRSAERVISFVEDHHENWDGSGYPRGRAGDHISIGGRVLAVSAAFVSLTSSRPYRPAVDRDKALDTLRPDIGTSFDPRVFEALRVVLKAGKLVS